MLAVIGARAKGTSTLPRGGDTSTAILHGRIVDFSLDEKGCPSVPHLKPLASNEFAVN